MSDLGISSNGAPGDGQGAPEGNPFDFERGYNELRPEYTRVTQELSTTRNSLSEYERLFAAVQDPDPEVQAAAMAVLGLELDTGSQAPVAEDDDFSDPLEADLAAAMKRLEALESARELETTAQEARELEALRDDYIDQALDALAESLKPQFGDNFKFSVREQEVLGNLAIAMEDDTGIPDVEAAFAAMYGDDGVLEENRSRWIASKTGAFAAPAGTSIPAEQRPATARERAEYIDRRVAALDELQR